MWHRNLRTMRRTEPGIASVPWRRSSYSGANGNCVEVALSANGHVAVRDSKQPGRRTRFQAREAWQCFVSGVCSGEFGG
ncbi:DUF397 domain-containing protein [Streptomyces sp. NRRL F-5135]|uniref:DUF397 domain-containing protein n=1 Tax=Streptomyces sp. NRRL F-5135 TaxID=1463858 RepID=UPI002D21BF58|nr:DUF397 domain-containing protein [Streptomyces sp. NRRL F-5135]